MRLGVCGNFVLFEDKVCLFWRSRKNFQGLSFGEEDNEVVVLSLC